MDFDISNFTFEGLENGEDIRELMKSHCGNHTPQYDPLRIDASTMVRNIFIIFFDVVGIFGNLLSCIVIKRYLLKTSGTYILFMFLAVSDSLVMLVLTLEILRHNFVVLMPSTTAGCAFHSFFFNFSFELSAWIILALTVERYLTIRAPFTHRERNKIIQRAWRIGGSIVVILTALNLQFFFTREVRPMIVDIGCFRKPIPSCYFRDNGTAVLLMSITNYIHAFAYAYIPYIVTFCFNIVLLYRLFVTRNYQQNRRTTVMLLLVTFSFIILTLPHAVYTIVINYTNKALHRELRLVVRDIGRVLVIINHSLNFAFYMTGRQFRCAVTKLFCSDRRRRRSSTKYVRENGDTTVSCL